MSFAGTLQSIRRRLELLIAEPLTEADVKSETHNVRFHASDYAGDSDTYTDLDDVKQSLPKYTSMSKPRRELIYSGSQSETEEHLAITGKRRRSDKQRSHDFRKNYKKMKYGRDSGDESETKYSVQKESDDFRRSHKSNDLVEQTILFRLRNGDLQQIRCMHGHHTRILLSATDRPVESISVYGFFTSNLRLSLNEKDNIIKEDLDVREIDWEEKRLRCSACNKSISISGDQALRGWLEHKLRCKSLQCIYRAEVERLDMRRTIDKKGKERTQTPVQNSIKLPAMDAIETRVQRRHAALKEDQLLGTVKPNRVWCKPCEKWVVLCGSYRGANWKQHKERLHIQHKSD